jgi:threonine synthase
MKDSDTVMSYHLGPGSENRPLVNCPVLIDPTLDALKEILGDALSG